MTDLPANGYLGNSARTVAEQQAALDQVVAYLRQTLGGTGGTAEVPTLKSDAVAERTLNAGVTIGSVLLRDGDVKLPAGKKLFSDGSLVLGLDHDANATDVTLKVVNDAGAKTLLELTDEGQLTLDNEGGGVILRVVDAAAADASAANPAIQFGYRTAPGGAFVALGKIEIAAGGEDVNIVPSGSGKMTVAGSEVITEATLPPASGLGIGQTWQDVTASRSHNTTYQNTTGAAIEVCVFGRSDAGAFMYFQVSTDGTVWENVSPFSGLNSTSTAVTIPNGHYYRTTGNFLSITSWAELRA